MVNEKGEMKGSAITGPVGKEVKKYIYQSMIGFCFSAVGDMALTGLFVILCSSAPICGHVSLLAPAPSSKNKTDTSFVVFYLFWRALSFGETSFFFFFTFVFSL
jgi:hypothetical protein